MSILLFFLLTLFNLNSTDDPAFETYSKGYMSISNENWTEAIIQFTKLIRMYPKSDYADDAQFWLSYSYKEKMQLENAFDEFKIVIEKYPSSDFVDKAKLERLNIARYMAKKNVERFISFMKNGGDFFDELVFKHSKMQFYQNKINDIRSSQYEIENKLNIQISKYLNEFERLNFIEDLKNNQLFFDRIIDRVTEAQDELYINQYIENYIKLSNLININLTIVKKTRLELYEFLNNLSPYIDINSISNLISFARLVNEEYYQAYKFIELKKWSEAAVEFNKFISKYPDSKMIVYAKFWLAYALKENNRLIQSFIEFEDVLKNSFNNSLIEEVKINRVIIAKNLAEKGEKKFINFLEQGSDFKTDIREIMIEIIKNVHLDTIKGFDNIFNLDFIYLKNNSNSINKMYHSKLIQNANNLAGKIKLYYGDFKINVNEIIK